MVAVWKRELQAYFFTPIGYVFMGVFLLVGGYYFTFGNVNSLSSDLGTLFGNLTSLFMLLVPILTMRVLSEERKNKTDQLLLTSPVSIGAMVVGKFLASCSVLLITLIPTLFYVIVIAVYGTPYWGEIFTNYLGFFLMGCCYIAIGVLMSSLSENQVSAAVLTFAVNLLLQILEYMGPSLSIPYMSWLPSVFSWLSLYTRYYDFSAGMLSLANVLYFLSFMAVVLFLTVRVIDKRRWSEG